MKNLNRKLGGKKAQSIGKGFEEIFCTLSRYQGFHVERMPDACKQISATQFIRTQSPFDYLMVKDFCFAAFFDCKTVEERTFSYSKIKTHQLESLSNLGMHSIAGYVVWFRKSNLVNFFDWRKLTSLSPGESLSDQDDICLGKIESFRLSRLEEEYKLKSYAYSSMENPSNRRSDSLC